MTYGWALLVIVVVGAALFALGVLNPGTYTQKRCTGFQYFVWQDHQITETQAQLSLINGNQAVNVTNLVVDTTDLGDLTGFTNPLSPATKFTITGAEDPTNKKSGDTYSYRVTVTYNVVGGGGIAGQKDFSTCTGTVV